MDSPDGFKPVSQLLATHGSYNNRQLDKTPIDSIDTLKRNYTDIDSIDTSRYAPKKDFKPATEEEVTAYEIASYLNDFPAYARHRRIIQKLGVKKARELLAETKEDIRLGKEKGKPVRNPAALYNWKATHKGA